MFIVAQALNDSARAKRGEVCSSVMGARARAKRGEVARRGLQLGDVRSSLRRAAAGEGAEAMCSSARVGEGEGAEAYSSTNFGYQYARASAAAPGKKRIVTTATQIVAMSTQVSAAINHW